MSYRLLLTVSLLFLALGACVSPEPIPDDLVPEATATPEPVNAPTPTATPEPTPTASPEPTPTATPAPPQLIDSWQDVVGVWKRDLEKNGVMTHVTRSFEPVQYPDQPKSAGFYRQRLSEDDGPETVYEGWYWVENVGEVTLYGVHMVGEPQTDETWFLLDCYRWEDPTRLQFNGGTVPYTQVSTTAEPR